MPRHSAAPPTRRWVWLAVGLAAVAVLVAVSALARPERASPPGAPVAAAVQPSASAAPPPSVAPRPSPKPSRSTVNAPARFTTRPPGSTLPSGAQCASWVHATPIRENKGANRAANGRTGHRVSADLFSGDTPAAASRIVPRIDGQFTGTTGEILRWAACKWGVDEDLVKAQAAIESWWLQGTQGDWDDDASACAPGHGLGADGRAGQCPQSFGILQDRHPYQRSAWPGVDSSTAMNADVAYGIWRACFEGYETWLNTVEQGAPYGAGDAWGCVGRWFSGRWHTAPSDQYVTRVKDYLTHRIWEKPDFQQP